MSGIACGTTRQTRGRMVPYPASNCTIFTEWQPISIPTIVLAEATLREHDRSDSQDAQRHDGR